MINQIEIKYALQCLKLKGLKPYMLDEGAGPELSFTHESGKPEALAAAFNDDIGDFLGEMLLKADPETVSEVISEIELEENPMTHGNIRGITESVGEMIDIVVEYISLLGCYGVPNTIFHATLLYAVRNNLLEQVGLSKGMVKEPLSI
ncbi:MAG: hypothetical protein ACM3UZ_03805 [Acidobacteriota bacterium]